MEDGTDPSPAHLIRALRQELGSHDTMAAELETSRQTIIRWEKGAEPSAPYRVKLADLSGRRPDEFRYGATERKPATTEQLAAAIAEIAEQLASQTRLLRRLGEVVTQLERVSTLLEDVLHPTSGGRR